MHLTRFAAAAATLLTALQVGAQPTIPDRFERRNLHDADAAQQLRQCDRGLTDATIERVLKEGRETAAGAPGKVSALASRDSRFHVLINGASWACLALSANDYPIWPLEVLRQTIVPTTRAPSSPAPLGAIPQPAEPVVSISIEAVNTWRRALLSQIAETGLARGLVVYGNGAGYAVYYTATKGSGLVVRYEGRHLKAGDFRPDDYPAVLSTPGVTGVSEFSYGTNREKMRVAFSTQAGAGRTLVDGGYPPLRGNPETAAMQFGGSVWKSESDIGAAELRLERDGVTILRSPNSSSFGKWRLAGDVLRVDVGSNLFYSLTFQDGRALAGEGRRRATPDTRANPNPSIDDDPVQDHYFRPRFYRDGDTETENRLRAEKQARFDALLARIELRRREILAESPQEEERLQREMTARLPKPEYNWRSCGEQERTELVMAFISTRELSKIGELCHSWMGSRKKWKATILTEGCRGRCRGF